MSEMNGGVYRNDLETRSLGSPYRRSQSIHDVYRRPIPVQSETGSETYSKEQPFPISLSHLQVITIQLSYQSHSNFTVNRIIFLKIIKSFSAKTLPHGRAVPPPPPTSGLQVRAVYSHDGDGDSKLSFTEGDMINIVGEKSSDGWQYGLNTNTGK